MAASDAEISNPLPQGFAHISAASQVLSKKACLQGGKHGKVAHLARISIDSISPTKEHLL